MGDGVEPDDPLARYDLFAEEYADHAATSIYNALYDRPTVLELLGDVGGLHVLDAGCGPGLYAEELIRRGGHVTAVDSSTRMVALAQDRLADDATVRRHDLTEPLRWADDQSFDVVLMALVIHHLDDRSVVLEEAHRVLRREGRLVVSTHHPMADWLRLGGSYFDIERIEEVWQRSWHVAYWRQPLQPPVTSSLTPASSSSASSNPDRQRWSASAIRTSSPSSPSGLPSSPSDSRSGRRRSLAATPHSRQQPPPRCRPDERGLVHWQATAFPGS